MKKSYKILPILALLSFPAVSETDPWDMDVDVIPNFIGVTGNAGASDNLLFGAPGSDFGIPTSAPAFRSNNIASGGVNLGYSVGCSGVNLNTIIDGKLNQYADQLEGFIKNAPKLAIFTLAYSEPTLKAILDGMDLTANFGMDFANARCSDAKQLAAKLQGSTKNRVDSEASVLAVEEDGLGNDPSAIEDNVEEAAKNLADSLQVETQQLMAASPLKDCSAVTKLDDNSTLKRFAAGKEISCEEAQYVVKLLPEHKFEGDSEKGLKTTPSKQPELNVYQWYDESKGKTASIINGFKAANAAEFDQILVELQAKHDFVLTEEQRVNLFNLANTKALNKESLLFVQGIASDLAHELTLLNMHSALDKVQLAGKKQSFGDQTTGEEDTFAVINDDYKKRLEIAKLEIDLISERYERSKKIREITSKLGR